MEQVAQAGKGVVLYMRQEGRGIGLLSKLKAYKLQEQEIWTRCKQMSGLVRRT